MKLIVTNILVWVILLNSTNSVFALEIPTAIPTIPDGFPLPALTPITKTAEVQKAEDMTNAFKESLTPDETSALREIGLSEKQINDIENDGNCNVADSNRHVCWSDESNTYVAATVTKHEGADLSLCPGDTAPESSAVACRDNGNLRADLLQEYTNSKFQDKGFQDNIYQPMIVPFAATMGLNMFNLFFAAFSAPFLVATCVPLPSTVIHITNSTAFLVQEVQILGEFNLVTDLLTKGKDSLSNLNTNGLDKKIQENVINDQTKGREAIGKLNQTLDDQIEPLRVLKRILTKSIDYVNKKRRNILISSIGYGLASVAASIELFTPMAAKNCSVGLFADNPANKTDPVGRAFFITWLTGVLAMVAKYVADKNKNFAKDQEKNGYSVTGYLFDVDKMGMLIISFVGAAITFGIFGVDGFLRLYNFMYSTSVSRVVTFSIQTLLASSTAVFMVKLANIYEQRIGFLAHLMDLMIERKDSAVKVGEAWVDGFDSTIDQINNSNNGMFQTENPLDVCTTKEIADGKCNAQTSILLPTPTP